MKRLAVLIIVVGFLAGISLSHSLAGHGPHGPNGPPPKLKVCHVDEVDEATGEVLAAHVLELPEPAYWAHIDHGDLPVDDPELAHGDDCTSMFAEPPPAE